MNIDDLTEIAIDSLNEEEEYQKYTLSQHDEHLIHDVLVVLKRGGYLLAKDSPLTPENMLEAQVMEQRDIDARIEDLTNQVDSLTVMVKALMEEREKAALKRIKAGEGYSND